MYACMPYMYIMIYNIHSQNKHIHILNSFLRNTTIKLFIALVFVKREK